MFVILGEIKFSVRM